MSPHTDLILVLNFISHIIWYLCIIVLFYIGDQNSVLAENGYYRMTEKGMVHFGRKQFHPIKKHPESILNKAQ